MTSCVSAKVHLCLILPHVAHMISCVSAKVLLCLILPHVAHMTSCISAKVLLCLILPHVAHMTFLCFSKGTSVPYSTPCGSYDFLCFSKGTSVPHSTPCGSYDFLCLIPPCGWTCRAETCQRPARPLKHRPVEGATSRTAAATPDPSQCETVALSSSTTCRLRRIRTTTTARKTSELLCHRSAATNTEPEDFFY